MGLLGPLRSGSLGYPASISLRVIVAPSQNKCKEAGKAFVFSGYYWAGFFFSYFFFLFG